MSDFNPDPYDVEPKRYQPPQASERDSHFAGFARLLWEEMLSQTEGYYIDVTAGHIPLHHPEDDDHKPYIAVIARRAYDLVAHTILHIDPYHLDALAYEDIPARIPDMTEWPENDKCG